MEVEIKHSSAVISLLIGLYCQVLMFNTNTLTVKKTFEKKFFFFPGAGLSAYTMVHGPFRGRDP